MKVSMLTFSQTGNTLSVGKTIEKALTNKGHDVDHIRFLNRKEWRPEHADIIGVGCPCFESRPAEIVPDFLKNSDFDFIGKKAFVYITSSSSPAKSLWRLAQAVAHTGATVIGGVQVTGVSTAPTMFGLTPNRPNRQDYDYVETFGFALSDHIIDDIELPEDYKIDPKKGSKFYDRFGIIANHVKKKMINPPTVDHEKCNLCGNCVYECPLDNITVKNKAIQVSHNCIVCWRCWHVCPNNALSMKLTPALNGLIEHFFWSERFERFFGELKPGEYRGPNLYRDVFAGKIRLKYDRKNPTADYEYVK